MIRNRRAKITPVYRVAFHLPNSIGHDNKHEIQHKKIIANKEDGFIGPPRFYTCKCRNG